VPGHVHRYPFLLVDTVWQAISKRGGQAADTDPCGGRWRRSRICASTPGLLAL